MASASAPPFQYEIEVSGDTTVIKCRGRIVHDNAGDVKQLVKPMIPKCRRIVLDLTGVDHIDSSGLGTLVGLKLSAGAAAYCRLEFINFSPRLKELLRITKLDQTLES